jgi:hypothetical protein
MITDHVISIKWATAINSFQINKIEDAEVLDEFRDWYTKASSINEVPQPYRNWVLKGLPEKYTTLKPIKEA